MCQSNMLKEEISSLSHKHEPPQEASRLSHEVIRVVMSPFDSLMAGSLFISIDLTMFIIGTDNS